MSITVSQYKLAIADTPSPCPGLALGGDSDIPLPQHLLFSKDDLVPTPRSSSGETTLTGSTPPRRQSCPGAVSTFATEARAIADNEKGIVIPEPGSFSKETLVSSTRSSGETTLAGSTPPIPPKSLHRRRSCPGAVSTSGTEASKEPCQAEVDVEERQQPEKIQPTIDAALGSFKKNELGARFSEDLSAVEEQENPRSASDRARATARDPAPALAPARRATTPPQHIVWADRATPEPLPHRPREGRSRTPSPRSRSPSPVPQKRHRGGRLRGLLCI